MNIRELNKIRELSKIGSQEMETRINNGAFNQIYEGKNKEWIISGKTIYCDLYIIYYNNMTIIYLYYITLKVKLHTFSKVPLEMEVSL